MNTDESTPDFPIEFPTLFPIKAIGANLIGFEQTILDIIIRHAPTTTQADLRVNPSKNGKYLSVTVLITATSRAQLDAIYQEISAHPNVLMAL